MKSLISLAFLSLGVVSLSQNAQAAETPSQPTVNQKGWQSEGSCQPGFYRHQVFLAGFEGCVQGIVDDQLFQSLQLGFFSFGNIRLLV